MPPGANGTGFVIIIDGTEFKLQHGYQLSAIKDSELVVQSPRPVGDEPSKGMMKFLNPYPEFTFDKISPQDYGNSGSLARITGIPANKPDYIADYHVIGIMRCIDYMLKQGYEGRIDGKWQTPISE